MENRLKMLYSQHKEPILYVVFGGLTTVVSYGSYALFSRAIRLDMQVSVLLSNGLSIAFAYITARTWVFADKAHGAKGIVREAASFLAGRLLTVGLDWGFMMVTVEALKLNDLWMKLISNVVVIVVNYVISKRFVFNSTRMEGAKRT